MNTEERYKITSVAYIATRVLDTPFWALFNLIPFILYKDLKASAFEIALLVSLKPITSILASYWSSKIHETRKTMIESLCITRLLAFTPFLFFPLIHNLWYLIFCFGLFMFLQVGMMPSWMEILKLNVPDLKREKLFSYCQAFGYLGGGLLPFVIGWILDEWNLAWHWMFPIAAFIALFSLIWQRKIPLEETLEELTPKKSHPILHPWKNALELLRRRNDFLKFQIGFMLMGSGLMIIQPALPVFFVDALKLNYTEVAVAITLCKGIGFAITSPLFARWVQNSTLFTIGAFIGVVGALFPTFLYFAKIDLLWLYIAYIFYGFMQAGSELSWNLSGPIFAKKEDSAPYSNVNIITVGIRGLFVPTIGAIFLANFGTTSNLILSATLCLLAALYMGMTSIKK